MLHWRPSSFLKYIYFDWLAALLYYYFIYKYMPRDIFFPAEITLRCIFRIPVLLLSLIPVSIYVLLYIKRERVGQWKNTEYLLNLTISLNFRQLKNLLSVCLIKQAVVLSQSSSHSAIPFLSEWKRFWHKNSARDLRVVFDISAFLPWVRNFQYFWIPHLYPRKKRVFFFMSSVSFFQRGYCVWLWFRYKFTNRQR